MTQCSLVIWCQRLGGTGRSQQLLASLMLDMKYEYMNVLKIHRCDNLEATKLVSVAVTSLFLPHMSLLVRNPPTFLLPTLSKSLGTRTTKYSDWQTWMRMEILRYWKFTADETAVGQVLLCSKH